jgi:RNA polymerase sigma-70 factor, ECF subfamily
LSRCATIQTVGEIVAATEEAGQLSRERTCYESFVQLFARCEPGLRAFVRPLVPTWDDAEEVIQQACVVLWRKYGDFEQGTDFLKWACTVAGYEVLKYQRSKARDRHQFSEALLAVLVEEGTEESAERDRERAALEDCIERLPPRQRELIRRCYGGGTTIKQVAESLGRSATGVYKALNRIRQALLECIEQRLAQEATP